MTHDKNRRLRFPLIFLGTMAVITFFSRTIYHTLTPNVDIGHITSGTLKYQFVIDEYEVEGDSIFSVRLGYLPAKLEVERVFVVKNQPVQAGTPLVQFQNNSGEEALRKIIREKKEAEIRKKTWEKGYQEALEEAKKAYKNSGSKVKREQAETRLKMLEDGIYDGTSADLLEENYQLYLETEEALMRLKEKQWIIDSPMDGWVRELRISEGEEYEGNKTILSLVDAGNHALISLSIQNFPVSYTEEWALGATLRDGTQQWDAMVTSIQRNGKETILKLSVDETWNGGTASRVYIELTSPYEPVLIENKLLLEGECFVLAERTGAWGQTEYYAEKRSVVSGDTDGKLTVVRSGLSPESRLIVSSTEELRNGMTVVLRQP